MRLWFSVNCASTPRPNHCRMSAASRTRRSSGSVTALSTCAVCRSRSILTRRWKWPRMPIPSWRCEASTRCTTSRARDSSSKPSTTHIRYRRRASRVFRFVVRIVSSRDARASRRELSDAFLREATLIVWGEHLPGDEGGGLKDEPPDLPFKIAEHERMLSLGGLVGLGENVLRRRVRLLRALRIDSRRGGTRLTNDHLGFGMCLGEDFATLRLGLGELGADLFRIRQAVRDLLTALLEHLEDGPIGQPVQQRTDDGEAERLGDQMRPCDAKRGGDPLDLTRTLRRLQQQGQHRPATAARGRACRTRSPRQKRWREWTGPSPSSLNPDCARRPPPTSSR